MRWVKSKRAVDLYTLINGRYYSDIKLASLCQITGYLTFCLTAYLGYQLEKHQIYVLLAPGEEAPSGDRYNNLTMGR